MNHAIYRVERFEIIGPYALRVEFDDGSRQDIDFRPILRGALYGPLTSLEVFNAVRLDPDGGILVWPNGADFDPATLHDWPDVRDELIARAHDWEDRSRGAHRTG